jgi:hypothetical protein
VRTTLRIDDDLLAELKRRARRHNLSLTKFIDRVLRRGLREVDARPKTRSRYRERTFSMGRASYNLDKALALAAALEDEAVVEKLAQRK